MKIIAAVDQFWTPLSGRGGRRGRPPPSTFQQATQGVSQARTLGQPVTEKSLSIFSVQTSDGGMIDKYNDTSGIQELGQHGESLCR